MVAHNVSGLGTGCVASAGLASRTGFGVARRPGRTGTGFRVEAFWGEITRDRWNCEGSAGAGAQLKLAWQVDSPLLGKSPNWRQDDWTNP